MDFGMPTLIEFDTLRENLALCSELGLDFVEFNMNFPQYQLDALNNTDALLSLAREYGCYYTIHLDENLDPFCFDGRVADAWLQTAVGAAQAAKRLGAPLLNMHLCRGVYITLPDRRVFLYSKYRADYLSCVRTFRDAMSRTLEGSDIIVSLENTDGFTEFQHEAIDILLQSPRFSLTWDIGHSRCAGEQDVPFIMENADRLRHMHVHDAEGRHCHLPFGEGELDIADRLHTAREHNCRCVIEVKTAEALRRSVEKLDKYI